MFKKLVIEGFQAHEKLVIELDPHVTTIIGRSDVGKSAIIRALRWLCFNRPLGKSFINWSKDECRVKLYLDNKRKIIRKVCKSGNSYSLDDKTFSAFGTGVPEEIVHTLNLNEDNFQGQHAPPFWFLKSSGEVSKELNAIVNLEVIDKALAEISSKVKEHQSDKNICERRLKEAREKEISLAWSLEADKDLRVLEQKEATLTETRQKLRRLDGLLSEGRELTQKRDRASGVKSDAGNVLAKREKVEELRDNLETLNEAIANHKYWSAAKKNAPSREAITKIESMFDRCGEIRGKHLRLLNHLDRVKEAKETLWQTKETEKKLKAELESLKTTTCPVCGKPLM
jgi:DNA repair protein SbcC/Rad50